MKKFITFGGGGPKYIDAGNRLIMQSRKLDLFDDYQLITDADLKNDSEFWEQHKDFISKNKRGYGYWLWKPYIIKKTMEKMNDGDILLYLDGGCELSETQKTKGIMNECFEYVKKDYIIGTLYPDIEMNWCKMDLLIDLNLVNAPFLKTYQRQGGTNMFLVCQKTKDIINEWYTISCNYHLIDDSPSFNKNYSCFREHRHDQSIFSLLTKKYGVYSNKTLDDCVHIIKNLSGVSKISVPKQPIQPNIFTMNNQHRRQPMLGMMGRFNL